MIKQALNKRYVRVLATITFALIAVIAFMLLSGTKADAKTIKIKTPAQMRNINWKNKGFGPGNTYKLCNDMDLATDLPNDEYGYVLLTKGKFTIDLNGHTLQSTDSRVTVISNRGANVTIKDSKAKKQTMSHPSIRSYNFGAIEMTKGSLNIKNGYYLGRSDGTNNPVALYVGGGKCVVNGGTFDGEFVGASTANTGKLYINGGKFIGRYMFALMHFGGGTIKIAKGTFTNTYQSYTIPTFAFGKYNLDGKTFNFKKWLASGAKFSPTIKKTLYWNGQGRTGSNTYISDSPTYTVYGYTNAYPYAVAWTGNSGFEPVTIKVKSSPNPPATKITSLKARSKGLTVKWSKKSKKTSGYQVQYSTSSKFKKAKIVTIKGKNKKSKVIKKLKGGKKYYVRVRTYRSFNATKYYSKWSKAKSKKTKK